MLVPLVVMVSVWILASACKRYMTGTPGRVVSSLVAVTLSFLGALVQVFVSISIDEGTGFDRDPMSYVNGAFLSFAIMTYIVFTTLRGAKQYNRKVAVENEVVVTDKAVTPPLTESSPSDRASQSSSINNFDSRLDNVVHVDKIVSDSQNSAEGAAIATNKKTYEENDLEDSSAKPLYDEEILWEMALKEVEGDSRVPGLWAKAFSMCEGEENRAKAKYIELRVAQLIPQTEKMIEQTERERNYIKSLIAEKKEEKRTSDRARIEKCRDRLEAVGYKLAIKSNRWEAKDKKGGRFPFTDIAELEQFVEKVAN